MEHTVDEHFEGKDPALRDLYCQLLAVLEGFGRVSAEPKKTCLHLVNRTALAGVYVRRDHIRLEFKTDHPLTSDLILKSEQISKNRFHHVVRLATPELLDGELRGWLEHAHSISG